MYVCVCSVRPVVCRCMELFVQQTSLVCPLSEAGKLRLAADYAQLEASLSPLCHKLSDLGRPYRMIRAIRSSLSYTLSFFLSKSLSVSVCLSIAQCVTNRVAVAGKLDTLHTSQSRTWVFLEYWSIFWLDALAYNVRDLYIALAIEGQLR